MPESFYSSQKPLRSISLRKENDREVQLAKHNSFLRFDPLTLKGDTHLTSSQCCPEKKHLGHENKGNYYEQKKFLMAKQIHLVSTKGNSQRIVLGSSTVRCAGSLCCVLDQNDNVSTFSVQ